MQCVLGFNNKYMIKEMSIVDTETWSTQHWIFKNSKLKQDNKSRKTNKWLERNYHQLSLEYGDIEYEEVGRILNSLKFTCIYVKGEQKKQVLMEYIPHIALINIEDIGCPHLDQICDDETLPCCIFHMEFNPKQCIVNVPAHLRPMPAAPITDQPVRTSVIQFAPRIDHQCDIQIAPQIFVPDIAAGGSNMVSSNETCIIIEDEDTDYITIDNGKRVSIANTVSAARAKKARIEMVRSRGLREISTSANRKIVWYYAKNMDKVQNYNIFLNALKSDLTNVLETHVKKNAIKFNLKLEATYNRPNVENSSENRAFKTSAVELFRESDILALVEESFTKLLTEEEAYTGRGSGFTLESIDGLLLGVYKYTPMSGSSYISLPDSIDRKKGTINPQNNDQQCFKWSILAKHVTEQTKCRIGENYRKHEGKYIFDGISFPTPLSDIKIFEKNNPFVSINIFGIEKLIQPPKKFPTYKISPSEL
ncbi:hypothetical protein QTP88_012307 [Uroleucon formosanum]